ncbi:MAG: hypothetical protein IJ326_05445 [Lachnospiraceae bacterium]|nr:hypothetical protein [Lachnospiraceae bacterium]
MRKKIVTLVSVVVFVVLAGILICRRSTNISDVVDMTTISKIVIYNPAGEVTITNQENIEKMANVLQSMNLKKSLPNNKDGYAFAIEIYHLDDEMNRIVVTSEDIVIDSNVYKCDRDYCDDIRVVYEGMKIPVVTEEKNLLEFTENRGYYCFDTESVGEYDIKLESDYVCQYQDKCYAADWQISLYSREDRIATEAIYSVNQTQAGFVVETDMFEEYMKVYTMEQGGIKYPLIFFQYSYEGENEAVLYERSFYTVKDNQVLLFHELIAESNKSPIAMQCNKEYIVNEEECTIADEQGTYTFDFLKLLITEECAYPKYFLSIIEELETSRDVYMQTITSPIYTYWDEGVTGGGKYEDAKFSCYIDGETYSFDGNDLLSDTEKWDWNVIGIYPDEIANKTYVVFHHFDVESETIENPALILLEFTTNNPSEYTLYPYETSDLLYWIHTCYRIENSIYIATENALVSIDLDTKELRFCEEEKNCVNDLVKEFYAQTSYEMYQFQATLQQDDTVVYSAFVSDAFDDTPVGLVAVAYEKGKPIAYMMVDLIEEDTRSNLKIKCI